jgi:RNA polymerase sigma-70 factor (ECF subfamily)
MSMDRIEGQKDAFRTLYDANHARVGRMLVRLVGPQDAEDVTQAVFAKAAKALPSFRGEADPSTWLYRIAANSASDWLRSRAAHEAVRTVPLSDATGGETRDEARPTAIAAADVDPAPSPEQQLASRDTSASIRGEIGKLPATQRTVLMLSALGGLADDEIAHTLGISRNSAKVRLHRARQAFKTIIAVRCDFYRNELSCMPASADCCAAPAATPPGR